jgi:AraC-like DNA-binding protein
MNGVPTMSDVPRAPTSEPLPYRERAAPAGLEQLVTCLWARPPGQARTVLVIPDGCVDLIWLSHGELVVAGPDRGPVEHEQPGGVGFAGIRLRPGVAGATIGANVSAIADQLVPAGDLWGRAARPLVDRLHRAAGVAAQLDVLTAAVAERGDGCRVDAEVAAVAADLAAGDARVAAAVRATGVSARQMRRRFLAQVGYGPKTLERIMRLQRFLDAARRSGVHTRGHKTSTASGAAGPSVGRGARPLAGAAPGLADLAAEAGYADQAHLTRECRALTDRTPAVLLRALG